MSAQDWIAYGLGLLAVAYLAWRAWRRRRAGTCCGEKECGAVRDVLRRLERAPE
jgi:hypothetical protein